MWFGTRLAENQRYIVPSGLRASSFKWKTLTSKVLIQLLYCSFCSYMKFETGLDLSNVILFEIDTAIAKSSKIS